MVVLLVAAGVAAAHPVRLFEHFKAPPPTPLNTLPAKENPIEAHILSAGSSGRWQQWGSAIDEFESAPGLGRGAGSYEAWWAQHGTLQGFVKDAHSLYLESLGELGIVGFLLSWARSFTVDRQQGSPRRSAHAGRRKRPGDRRRLVRARRV